MTMTTQLPKGLADVMLRAATASDAQLVQLAKNRMVRGAVVREAERLMLDYLKDSRSDPTKLPGVEDDRAALGLAIVASIDRALVAGDVSDAYVRSILQTLVRVLFLRQDGQEVAKRFEAEHGIRPPSFLVLSPGRACNLRCVGCYADSTDHPATLEWSVVDRMIDEAKTSWGARFFVFSGGEPFAYRSEGKGILDLIEKHRDCFFLTFTNATLIDERVCRRLSCAGNMLVAASVEGWRERTDERRGAGVFDRVLEAMRLMRRAGVPFGISLTATRHNAEETLSDAFVDFFMQQGTIFAWIFQYMPIGRAFTLDLMVTPQQRAWMWRRSWEIVRERRFFMADFWNHGTAVGGCLSAGGHGNGGYFYIDWNGAVSPCVFVPYSPVNIKDIYARGGTLADLWDEPFFRSLRDWQLAYGARRRNGLAPCPNRDHHDELAQLLREFPIEPTDANAAETLIDPAYTCGLVAYNRAFEALTDGIWEQHYVHRTSADDGSIAPLPDVAPPDEAETAIGLEVDVPSERIAAE